jgi:hypothetical protein
MDFALNMNFEAEYGYLLCWSLIKQLFSWGGNTSVFSFCDKMQCDSIVIIWFDLYIIRDRIDTLSNFRGLFMCTNIKMTISTC